MINTFIIIDFYNTKCYSIYRGIIVNNLKDNVISLIKELPDNCTLEDIMEHLYVKQKILKSQKQLKEGHYYSHEEAKQIMKSWLK